MCRPVLLPSFCFLLLCSLTNCALNQSSTAASPKTQSLPQTPKTFHRLFLKTHKTLIKAHTTLFSTHSRSHSQISYPPLPISTDNHFRTQIFTSEASIEHSREKTKKAYTDKDDGDFLLRKIEITGRKKNKLGFLEKEGRREERKKRLQERSLEASFLYTEG